MSINQNFENIEKTDDLSKWRTKINNVFSMLKNMFPTAPKNKKTVLMSDGDNFTWEEIPNQTEQNQSSKEERTSYDSLKVSGILSTEHIVVNNIGMFSGNLEVKNSITASSLLLNNNPTIQLTHSKYGTVVINITEKGLQFANISILNGKVSLDKIYFDKCHLETTSTSLIFVGNNNNTPFAINFKDNTVFCSTGIRSPILYFDKNNSITSLEYSGNANSANKLKNKVRVFGQVFDGSKDIVGTISDCTGIKFAINDIILEFPSEYSESNKLEENNGVLIYTGEFIPNRLNVKSEHYAEYYPSAIQLEKGDVISYDFNSIVETYVKVNKVDGHPLGVVTDDFAMIIGEKKNNSYPVCNRGRVYAKVIGKVDKGDNLCVSAYDGILCKLHPKDKITDTYAISLEKSDNENLKLIKIHIL